MPLIGFAGAPFTLASYLVEGGPSRNHERTKAMMFGEPDTWHALMTALTDVTIGFLRAQLDAGVDAIQLFDSWAGTLSLADYRSYVLPHSTRVFDALAGDGVPMTHFGVGTAELLGAMGEAGATVVGVDWRTSLADAAPRVGPGKALQGNLDPVVLLAGWPAVERAVRAVVRGRPRGRSTRAPAATCSISGTGCCPPPIRASSPKPWRWCTRCETGVRSIALSGAAFRAWSPPTGCGWPRVRTPRSRCSTPPTGWAGCCAPNGSAARPWTSGPRRSSRAARRFPRCSPNSGWRTGRSAPRACGR